MIQGKKREQKEQADFKKVVGIMEATVVAINPDAEEFKDVLDIELKEDSKATEYIGVNTDGNKTARVDFWLEEVNSKNKYKVSFFLEDKERENKDGSKKQFINNIGMTCWGVDENSIPEWFIKSKREVREAHIGEEDLYNFLRVWLGGLDYADADTTLEVNWSKLMKGNVKELKELINGEFAVNILALATIKTVIKDDETKEYQGIYNKAFLPAFNMKQFKSVNYDKEVNVSNLKKKQNKDLKPHERFVLNVTGEYGCRDFFSFSPLKEYSPEDNITSSDKAFEEDDSEF